MSRGNQARAEAARKRRDELAELVANGAGVIEAGATLGIERSMAKKLWTRIRHDLGSQAV